MHRVASSTSVPCKVIRPVHIYILQFIIINGIVFLIGMFNGGALFMGISTAQRIFVFVKVQVAIVILISDKQKIIDNFCKEISTPFEERKKGEERLNGSSSCFLLLTNEMLQTQLLTAVISGILLAMPMERVIVFIRTL